jgi:RNA-directed DNA polymerase
MTVTENTGAFSHMISWHSINWKKVYRNVRRLQARIVKAIQEGRWGKVKALQHLLIHSFSGKATAVRRVTENQGKKTPGVDKVTWETPSQKTEAILSLQQHGYQTKPLRRIYIPKKNGKKRPLGIPTMKDRAMQALHLLALQPIAETTGDPNSYGFRPERSTADAMRQCHLILARKNSAPYILEGDIRGCFDEIQHEWLLQHIPMDKGILEKWLKSGYMERNNRYPTEAGTPQGSPISPVLANMTLDGLEKILKEKFSKAKVNMVRYADDFIITGKSEEFLEKEVKPIVEQFLKERGLELSPEKTLITHIDTGFDFLGQNARKYKGKMLIKPSKKSIKTFLEKIRTTIKENKGIKAGKLIEKLNLIIRGWALYHRHMVSKKIFTKVDHEICKTLKKWGIRRHPNKPKRWIVKKYFKTIEGDHWRFYGENKGKEAVLIKASHFPIRRHIKIKSQANPFDPSWEMYFEERQNIKTIGELKGKQQLIQLWKRQKGICPICEQKITSITGWHKHHVIWRSKGGADTIENLVLLHPNCHQQLHAGMIPPVKKPCPSLGI